MARGKAALCVMATMAFALGHAQSPASASGTPTAQAAPSNAAASPTASPAATSATAPASSASSTSTAPPASSTASATPADLSPDLLKKARREGYKPEVQKNGETLFCVKDASLGTRFETKKCIQPDQLQAVIDARQDQRNQLERQGACSSCSGH